MQVVHRNCTNIVNNSNAVNQDIKMENKSKIICPVQYSLDILSGKWKLPILHALHKASPKRFKELERELDGITPTMLTTQLRDLEKNGLVSREIFATVPPTVEYRTTELGKTLKSLIYEFKKWGLMHMKEIEAEKS
ncbi:MAG: transcriptional regulator [Bacteroidetes bacterium]|nr:MAG: transcriptional regulator [Bacteroidota bacterium]